MTRLQSAVAITTRYDGHAVNVFGDAPPSPRFAPLDPATGRPRTEKNVMKGDGVVGTWSEHAEALEPHDFAPGLPPRGETGDSTMTTAVTPARPATVAQTGLSPFEEFDVDGERHLGNFPQAFSHLALIEAAGRIILAERLDEVGLSGRTS